MIRLAGATIELGCSPKGCALNRQTAFRTLALIFVVSILGISPVVGAKQASESPQSLETATFACPAGQNECLIQLAEQPLLVTFQHNCGVADGKLVTKELTLVEGFVSLESRASIDLAANSIYLQGSATFYNVIGVDPEGNAYQVEWKSFQVINDSALTNSLSFQVVDPQYTYEFNQMDVQDSSQMGTSFSYIPLRYCRTSLG